MRAEFDSVLPSPIPSPLSGSPLNTPDISSFIAAMPKAARPLFLERAWSLLSVVDACDSYQGHSLFGPFGEDLPCRTNDGEVPFYYAADDRRKPIGFLLPAVVEALLKDNASMEMMKMQPCWKALRRKDDESVWAMAIADELRYEGKAAIDEHFDRLARGWKEAGMFASELIGAHTLSPLRSLLIVPRLAQRERVRSLQLD